MSALAPGIVAAVPEAYGLVPDVAPAAVLLDAAAPLVVDPLVPLVPRRDVSPALVSVRTAPSFVTRTPREPVVPLCCASAGAAARASASHAALAVEYR
jgi:hypothetical protein